VKSISRKTKISTITTTAAAKTTIIAIRFFLKKNHDEKINMYVSNEF